MIHHDLHLVPLVKATGSGAGDSSVSPLVKARGKRLGSGLGSGLRRCESRLGDRGVGCSNDGLIMVVNDG